MVTRDSVAPAEGQCPSPAAASPIAATVSAGSSAADGSSGLATMQSPYADKSAMPQHLHPVSTMSQAAQAVQGGSAAPAAAADGCLPARDAVSDGVPPCSTSGGQLTGSFSGPPAVGAQSHVHHKHTSGGATGSTGGAGGTSPLLRDGGTSSTAAQAQQYSRLRSSFPQPGSSLGASPSTGAANISMNLSGQTGSHITETLTGALPLEALPALRLSKMGKHQSFILQAIKDQVRGW